MPWLVAVHRTPASSTSARDRTLGRSRRRVDRHPEHIELAEDRPPNARPIAGIWAPAGVSCDNLVVERVHPRRPRARSVSSGPFFMMAIGPIVAGTPSDGQLPSRGGLLGFKRILTPVYNLLEPFSPTKKVTGTFTSSVGRSRI